MAVLYLNRIYEGGKSQTKEGKHIKWYYWAWKHRNMVLSQKVGRHQKNQKVPLVASNTRGVFGFGCLKKVLFDFFMLQLGIHECILSGYDLHFALAVCTLQLNFFA